MYHFYQNNQLLNEQAKVEISLYEAFEFINLPSHLHVRQMRFTLFNQSKILSFFYNAEERDAGMIYNMGQFLDLVEDLLLSSVSQPIHLPLCDFWMKVMFNFNDHPVWAKMWPELEIFPSFDSEDEDYSEDEDEVEESEVEESEVEESEVEESEEEEDGEWLESGDEDWVPESEDEDEDEEEDEEEDEDEDEEEDESRRNQMNRQEEKNAFFLRNITYHPEERKMRCQFCGSRASKTLKHIQSDRHRACVSTQLGGNMNLF